HGHYAVHPFTSFGELGSGCRAPHPGLIHAGACGERRSRTGVSASPPACRPSPVFRRGKLATPGVLMVSVLPLTLPSPPAGGEGRVRGRRRQQLPDYFFSSFLCSKSGSRLMLPSGSL